MRLTFTIILLLFRLYISSQSLLEKESNNHSMGFSYHQLIGSNKASCLSYRYQRNKLWGNVSLFNLNTRSTDVNKIRTGGAVLSINQMIVVGRGFVYSYGLEYSIYGVQNLPLINNSYMTAMGRGYFGIANTIGYQISSRWNLTASLPMNVIRMNYGYTENPAMSKEHRFQTAIFPKFQLPRFDIGIHYVFIRR